MKYKQFGKKVIIRIDQGEEIVESLTQICNSLKINFGTITGLGAVNKVTIGLFDTKTKEYHSTELTGDHEIAPLYGNITSMNNKPYLHLHANLCDNKHKSFGGHLNKAIVSATFEGIIDIIDGKVERKFDSNIKLNLLKI